MSLISPRYSSVFSWIISGEYLSLQYVNSMNYIVSVWLGSWGGFPLYGWFRMHNISRLSLALHWHLCVWLLQLLGSSQFGTVFFCVWPSYFPAFTRVKHQDLVLDISSLQILWIALLFHLMQSLYMWGFVQHSSICSHVSGWVILNSGYVRKEFVPK